ncbi:K+/H+ antiporter, partial [Bacillus licheniformis]
IGKANAEIIEFEVDDQAAITRQMLKDISFPKDALINAIIRNGDLVTPHGETKIKPGDILYILVSKKQKKELKKFLNREFD